MQVTADRPGWDCNHFPANRARTQNPYKENTFTPCSRGGGLKPSTLVHLKRYKPLFTYTRAKPTAMPAAAAAAVLGCSRLV
jgi:hypothetical protein